ncbi:HEPN domain-containing protein, partial [bacterium]|nr:HEPN domain-containing protein [bacterium]
MATPNWTIAVPVYNLKISDEIGGILQIERVKFISANKIPRMRQRLNIPYRISTMNQKLKQKKRVFSDAETYAFLSTSKSKDPHLINEHNLIREAIWILRSSQFARTKRTVDYSFGLPIHSKRLISEEYRFEIRGQKANWNRALETPIQPYVLDRAWKNFLTHHFFLPLLSLLNKKRSIKTKWLRSIRKAAILAGKSHYSSELSEAFLFDIIALETLLHSGERNEQIAKVLYERLYALFGWMNNDDPQHLEQIVERIYGLRCDFVHRGDYSAITVEDLITTDEILLNLLYNICHNINFFSDRQKVIEIQARRTLGL